MNLKKNPRSDSKATALKAGEVKDEGRSQVRIELADMRKSLDIHDQ